MASTLTWADFKYGAAMQARVIGALTLRELRSTFGDRRLGYAWALLPPLVGIAIMSSVFFLIGARPSLGTSFEAFFFTGFVTFQVFLSLQGKAMGAIPANKALLSFPPVKTMDTIWARLALETITQLFMILFVMTVLGYLDVPIIPADPMKYCAGMLSIIVLGSGFGIFNAIFSQLFKPWSMIVAWIMRIQFFASGVFFLPESMPPAAYTIMEWNPTSHCLAYVREGFYPMYQSAMLHESYPFVWGISLALLGLMIEKLYRRKLTTR